VIPAAEASGERRKPLTKERVLRAAVDLADRAGIEALSMRKLGQELAVDAMALYRHVRNKDEILDGIVDVVVGEIGAALPADDWKAAMRHRVITARQVMLRHPWAPRVIEERATAGPAILGYMESILTILLDGGFSIDLAHHAIHVMGSRILGFNQDLFEDSEDAGPGPEAAAILARAMADTYPRVTELALAVSHDGGLGGCDDDFEFEFGLDLILDGLERLRAAPGSSGPGLTG
jgi:AcrR family transcriptional regulator